MRGRRWPQHGRFLRLQRPTFIEHTWLSPGTLGLESVVRLDLNCDDGATLTHEGLPDNAVGRQHSGGWEFVLAALAQRFAR